MSWLRPLRSGDADGDEAKVDIAPLIDVVFLLLIFYVVATTFVRPTAVPIERPVSSQSAALPLRPLVVTVAADGSAWLEQDRWRFDDVDAVRRALRGRSAKRVLLHADGAVPTRVLVQAIDSCRAAGAEAVDLAADQVVAP